MLKRTQADKFFSLCVRERANWTCELCHTYHPDAAAKGSGKGLDCSHYIGRGNWSVRFDPNNAFAHCMACHFRFGGDALAQYHHYCEVFGEGMRERLMEKKQDTTIGRRLRKEVKEIAEHYRNEYNRMRELRAKGEMGRLGFVGYE